MDCDSPQPDTPQPETPAPSTPSAAEDFFDLPDKPKRRAEFIQPETKRRKFVDGTPRTPSTILRGAIKKLREIYQYSKLGPGEDIRVLIVERGSGSDPVRCKLVPSALPGSGRPETVPVIHYEALSYYWGLDKPTIPITVTSYNRTSVTKPTLANIVSKKFWIRPNLHAALLHLRLKEREVALWSDALCINQEDQDEKTAQVKMMHEIYGRADYVCIWLGVGEQDVEGNVNPEDARRTFKFIGEMLTLRRLDQLIVSEKHAAQWLAFVRLMRNRWFSRRWVVQELALAKEATVHYGAQVIQWRDFADAVALFVTKHDEINALLKRCNSLEPEPIGDMRALGANALVEATSNLFRRSNSGDILERLLSLETLVSTLLAFEATDPRDTIYAVLSIANDTPYSNSDADTPIATSQPSLGDPRITPDYTKNLADICCDFTDYCVEKSKSLDIICRHWAPARWTPPGVSEDPKMKMPTWISLISGSAFGEPEAALEGRSNGDSLVGTPNRQNQKNYNASAGLWPCAKFGRDGNTNTSGAYRHGTDQKMLEFTKRCNGILRVKGLELDTIDKLSPRAAQGMILQECLEMGGWQPKKRDHNPEDQDTWTTKARDYDPKELPDQLWRTLVADRGPDGKNAPSWYRRACLECLAHVIQPGDLSTGALVENPSTPSTMVTFLRRVQQVVWNRKFLQGKNKEKGKELFGLAPTSAREGDIICILFGCSVPVILRKVKNEKYFHFIGESYIHGRMDGEALAGIQLAHPYHDFDEFEIR